MSVFGLVSLIFNFFSPLAFDFNLTNKELTEMRGYKYDFYETLSDDGYFLGMHRITKNLTNGHPVLLINGYFVRTRCWIVIKDSLPLMLADLGYDVWLGDYRGNPPYSQKHVNFSVYSEKFWDFSFHEVGAHDIPAMIDFVLNTTNREKLSYVGLSIGSTLYFTLLSEREEYNRKISSGALMVPYVPATKLKNYTPFFRLTIRTYKSLLKIFKSIGYKNWDVKQVFDILPDMVARTCEKRTKEFCYQFLDLLFGGNTKKFDLKSLGPILKSVIGYTSMKTTEHCLQMMLRGRFQKYDYGKSKNIEIYGSEEPPEYNLTKVQVPTGYFYSNTDAVVPYQASLKTIKSIRKVEAELFPGFSHIEMAVGPRSVLVYRKAIKFIEKNSY